MGITWEELEAEYIEKAGLPVGTISGNYKKISDNPSKWEYVPKDRNKPTLIERNHLSKVVSKAKIDISKLKILSSKEFSEQVDFLYSGNMKDIKSIMRLPNINSRLASKIGLPSIKCYFTKKQFTHSRPQRKSVYGQDLRIEEFKRIPLIIHNSNVLYYDKENKNFFIPFSDRQDSTKINKISFYKDALGNYAVSVGKIDKSKLKDVGLRKVGVGVAPTIHKAVKPCPITRLSVSPTCNKSIPHKSRVVNKSVYERVKEIFVDTRGKQ